MEQTTNRDEFEKLIELAEDVSSHLKVLNIKKSNFKMISFLILSVGGLLILAGVSILKFWFNMDTGSDLFFILLISTLCLIAIVLFSIYYSKRSYNVTQEVRLEKEILKNLLEMVYEYKDNVYSQELSIVEQAVFDMRLQRIKFSPIQEH